MTTRHFSPLFFLVFKALCLTSVLNFTAVSAADHLGPVFPRNAIADEDLAEPLPLPKRNSLLQRPQSRQVVFDDIDPVGSIIPQSLLYEEDFDFQPQPIRQRQNGQSQTSRMIPPVINTSSPLFTDDGAYSEGEIIGEYPFDTQVIGPFPVPFGMGLFDNITLFAELTTFKTGFSEGAGSFGINEGINWSTALTPQGSLTGQFGVRALQGDFASVPERTQLFFTAGLFKRFDFARLQGGVAVDWLEDRTRHVGAVNLRQMRCEISTRILGNLECGFIGAFDVFWDHPKVWYRGRCEYVDVHDHYLFFARKHLDNGGQVELRSGLTSNGGVIINALGEVAISDRLAVNGGFSYLVPSEGTSYNPHGNRRESWSMSMGIVIYFRGGAVFRQMNSHRAMFDVAGNNSFLTRIVD